MLTEEQLEKYLVARGVTAPGVAHVKLVRASDPSRAVGSGPKHVASRFASRKMGRTVQAESRTCELAAVWTWEFDPHTYEFWDQALPLSLPIVRADGRRTHQAVKPDFLLLQENYVGWVECKTRQWLEGKRESGDVNFVCESDGRWRYLPGETFARAWGMGYVVRVADENNPVLIGNFSMLDEFFIEDVPPVPEAERRHLVEAIVQARWMLISEVCEAGVNVDHLYTLIAQGLLYVDLENSRLNEPWRTYVYLDQAACRIHKAMSASEFPEAAINLTLVDLTRGARVMWDGRPWQILNAGAMSYTMKADGGGLADLTRQEMEALISGGTMLADPAVPAESVARTTERLQTATDAEWAAAMKKYAALFPASESDPPEATPERTLTKWRSQWRSGLALYGNGLVGLLPNIHRRGNRLPKLPVATMEIIQNVIVTEYLTPEAPTLKAAWGLICIRCEAAGTIEPSEKAVSRAIARRFTEVQLVEAREGAKRAYQIEQWIFWLEPDTPRHGQRPFERAYLDHTVVDLQLVDPRFGRETGKCSLSVLIDGYSRKVLAQYVTFDPPSYRSCMMIVRECVRRHSRIPATIVVDNGPEFGSDYFDQLLAFLRCTKTLRPKGKPRHGTLIELLFGKANVDFIHALRGNNKPLQTPRSMSPTHDPRKRAVWTLAAFSEELDRYFNETYDNLINENLGVSPAQAFRHGLAAFGEREHTRIAYDDNFKMITLPAPPSGKARVQSNAYVKINSIPYSADALAAPTVVGTDVPVRYDPFNVGVAYAQISGRWIQLKSAYYAIFRHFTERELKAASAELRDLHRASYGNRRINVIQLARHLEKVHGLEAQLIADAEARRASEAAQTAIAEAAWQSPPPPPSPPIAEDDDPFADVEIEEYGDIE